MQRRPHTPRQPRAVSGASGYSVWRTAAWSGGASSSRMLASCRVGRPRTLLHCEEGRREIRSGSVLLNEEILLTLQFFWGKNIIIIIIIIAAGKSFRRPPPQPPVVHRAPSDLGGEIEKDWIGTLSRMAEEGRPQPGPGGGPRRALRAPPQTRGRSLSSRPSSRGEGERPWSQKAADWKA